MSRRRYVWDPSQGCTVEVTPDYVGEATSGLGAPVSDLYMLGDRAPDGADIGSRRKRREYMKAHQVADAGDFTQHWERAAQRRQEIRAGQGWNRQAISIDVMRAMEKKR